MKNEIVQYFNKINSEYPNYYENEDFSNLDANIKSYFNNYGIAPIVRTDKTDVSFLKKILDFNYRTKLQNILIYFGIHILVVICLIQKVLCCFLY